MEKSNGSDKNEGKENNIEEDPENDEVQKERVILKRIYKNCSKFNSADDVRQAQNYENGGEGLVIYDVEESNVLSRNEGDHNNGKRAKAVPKNKKKEKNDNDSRRQKSRSDRDFRTRDKVEKVPKKRPGGPSKAGPRRKLKKSTAQQRLMSISCSCHSSSSSLLSRSSGY